MRILIFLSALFITLLSATAQVKVKKANRLFQVESRMEEKVEPGLFGKEKKPVEYLRYDDRGRVIERVNYNRSGDVSYRESRAYDGKLITLKSTFGPRGKKELRRAEYSYNEKGLLIEERIYIRGRLRFLISYTYLEGLLVKERWETPRKRFIKERNYTYTFGAEADHELTQPSESTD
jgi:hypothetical protein